MQCINRPAFFFVFGEFEVVDFLIDLMFDRC